MKIVHIFWSFTTGGAETMLVDIVNEQIKQADIFLIVVNRAYNLSLINKIDKRVKVYLVNRKSGSKNPFPLIKLNRYLLTIKPQVIHCHNHNMINCIFPVFRKKTVFTMHGIGHPIDTLKKYKKVFSISNSVNQDIEKRSKINSTVVYNGVNVHSINNKSVLYESGRFKVVQVSRLETETKGQHIVIEAIKILRDNYSNLNVQLDFIGEGKSEEKLKKLVEISKLNDRIQFLGLKDREYIYKNLCNYDLLVQPSLYEGFGLTIVEAMAAKVPVLVSNIDGPMEIIENGKYGYFFESGNPTELAEKIHYIYSNYDSEVTHKIELAYDYVKYNFDIAITVRNYINNYYKIL